MGVRHLRRRTSHERTLGASDLSAQSATPAVQRSRRRDPELTMRDWLTGALWDVAPADPGVTSAEVRRRRAVTILVILIGSILLGISLRIPPGSIWFYPACVGLAAVWLGGAVVSGPLHLGRITWRGRLRRPILSPLLIGTALAGLFVAGALVVQRVPSLATQVRSVTDHADEGSVALLIFITALNGVAEEFFFRGAVYESIPRYPVATTTLIYGLVTLGTGNAMLAFAALVLGLVVGLERRASGGILAPIITHVMWSLTMLVTLPAIVG